MDNQKRIQQKIIGMKEELGTFHLMLTGSPMQYCNTKEQSRCCRTRGPPIHCLTGR